MIRIAHVYVPEDCEHGLCDCESAKDCKFARCENCDNIVGENKKALIDHDAPEHRTCPDCGGKLEY